VSGGDCVGQSAHCRNASCPWGAGAAAANGRVWCGRVRSGRSVRAHGRGQHGAKIHAQTAVEGAAN
jgi:hypothetical protein